MVNTPWNVLFSHPSVLFNMAPCGHLEKKSLLHYY